MLREFIQDMVKDRYEGQVAEMAFEEVFGEHEEMKRKKNLKRRHDKRHKRYERGGKLEENRYRHEFRSYNSNRCCAWNLSQCRRRELRKELNAQLNEMREEEMCAIRAANEARRVVEEIEYSFKVYWKAKELEGWMDNYERLWDGSEACWDAYLAEQRAKRAEEPEFDFSHLSDVELEALEKFLSA